MVEILSILKTGRVIGGMGDNVGLSSDLKEIWQGYDSLLRVGDDVDITDKEFRLSHEMSQAEAVELADIMIARWSAFKAKHTPQS